MSAQVRPTIRGTTLACVDCRHPALALRALRLSLERCAYEDAIFLTDADPGRLEVPASVRVVKIGPIADSSAYSRFMLKELAAHIATPFVQVVQWDGYVVAPEAWTDEFLEYDYIGARWWFRPEGSDVGNGGFSLRSRRLLDALAESSVDVVHPEDEAICLRHRGWLERERGIRFAPTGLARRYAFEGDAPNGREFGFHRAFNLAYFHGRAELREILDGLGAAAFDDPVMVTLVHKLAKLGRAAEALEYGRMIRASAARAGFPPEIRALLSRTMLSLVPRMAACPCGSGLPYRRCCGEAGAW